MPGRHHDTRCTIFRDPIVALFGLVVWLVALYWLAYRG